MKRFLLLFFTIMLSTAVFSQEAKQLNIPQSASEPVGGAYYKLFPTSNMWTFLKLDTRNGRIWREQFTLKDSKYRFENIVSIERLVDVTDEKPGRFTLYATENIYNFIMLDQIDGRCWQVQWGESPVIIRIY